MVPDIFLTVFGAFLLILGFIGCILPVLPGPILSFISLILLSIAGSFSLFSPALLIILGTAAVVSQLLDNLFPVISSKRAGAGKAGIWGSIIGMIAGMFFAPFGVIIGAFLGALLGEILFNRANDNPLKAALGVFTGTLLGIIVKLTVSGIIAGFYLKGVRMLFN